jgi:serine/threonine-protein kinase
MTVVAVWALTRPAPLPRTNDVVRFSVTMGENVQGYLGSGPTETRFGVPVLPAMALSPDGKLLVYAAWDGTGDSVSSRLYIRRLNEERAEAIPGSEGGIGPFFSPGGDWIGFFAGMALKRVRADGGTPQTIASEALTIASGAVNATLGLLGATWGDDDTILYGRRGALFRVAATGGTPTVVLPADTTPGSGRYAMPYLLPGARSALVGIAQLNPARTRIVAIDLESRKVTPLLTDAQHPLYVATGQLLFLRQGVLMAVGFDATSVTVKGEPVPVVEGISQAMNMPNTDWETGAGQLAVSRAGHLAFAEGGTFAGFTHTLVRVSPGGQVTPLGVEAPNLYSPRVSPSGDRVAFHAALSARTRGSAIFVHDLVRGVTTRVAADGFTNWRPVWSPDGRTILYTSNREDEVANMYAMPAEGGGAPRRLVTATREQSGTSWSPDGTMTFLQSGDIWTITPGGSPTPFVVSEMTERFPAFSPDGRWVAYTSDRGGQSEVFVRPFPGPDPATQISDAGGIAPVWARDGKRLYYLSNAPLGSSPSMMVVQVTPGPPFHAGRAARYISSWPYVGSIPVAGYDVDKDGSFIVPMRSGGRAPRDERTTYRIGEIHVVLNFLDELRARVK